MRYYIICFIFSLALNSQAQGITVIHIQGDTKTLVKSGKSKKSGFAQFEKNLSYGPLAIDQTLILTKNSTVKMIRDDGYQCEISGEGVFLIKDLKFVKLEDKSTLTTFLDYFKSFFVAHPNSESKEYYNNSIAAISKGKMVMPPLLAFPFPGVLPLVKNELEFSWDVSCDTCTYVLTVQDVEKKQIVLQEETKQHSYKLKKPEKYLTVNKKYLWLVEVKYSKQKSQSQFFTISDTKDYKNKIATLEKSFSADNHYLTPVTLMISIFSALEKEKLTNHMILYGLAQIKKHPKDRDINDIYNRVYYDQMKRRRI